MKLWFAPGSEVPLYRQMHTQVVLAILSGDLEPGQKLPSTRALARRFAIHPNTVSAAYQQLEQENWVESRRGSGVFVRDRKPRHMTPGQILDVHIAGFFRAVRELGLPVDTVRAQVAQWLSAPPADHLLLIEDDAALARILLTELRAHTTLPVIVITPEACRADRDCVRGAVPVCRPTRRDVVQEAVGVGTELLILPINSAGAWLTPFVGSTPGHLIAVVSHWPEFVETARTMLLATGVPGEALMLVDANSSGWSQGLAVASAIVCDAYTASCPGLPGKPRQLVFPLLASSVPALLKHRLPTPVGTPAKASQSRPRLPTPGF